MPTFKELEQQAKEDFAQEKLDLAKSTIIERLKELELTERALSKLRKQYEELLAKDVDDIVADKL